MATIFGDVQSSQVMGHLPTPGSPQGKAAPFSRLLRHPFDGHHGRVLQRRRRGRCRRRCRRGQDAAGAVADHASGPGFGAGEVQKMAEVVLELLQDENLREIQGKSIGKYGKIWEIYRKIWENMKIFMAL